MLSHRRTETREYLIAELALQSQRLIRQVIDIKLRTEAGLGPGAYDNADDICQSILVTILSRLSRGPRAGSGRPIENPHAYIRRLAENAYQDYRRRKYPQYRRVTRSLRYVFATNPSFSLWLNPVTGTTVCGYKEWKGQLELSDDLLQQLRLPPLHARGGSRARLDGLVASIFEAARRPLPFKKLVSIVAEVRGLKDARRISFDEAAVQNSVASRGESVLDTLDRRQVLFLLWEEIMKMSLEQRHVLLLGLRDEDGDELVSVFVSSGVVGVGGLAASLGLNPEEFLSLWDKLPLPDAEIALRLNKTKLQVSNIRNAVRKRLKRSMRKGSPVGIADTILSPQLGGDDAPAGCDAMKQAPPAQV